MRRDRIYRATGRLATGLLAAALAGCATLPDLQRAEYRLQQGDRAGAEREYRPLAQFGLPAAQLALGDLLSSGTAAQQRLDEAVGWYERAARRDSRGLARLAGIYARDPGRPPAAVDALLDRLVRAYDLGERALAGDIGDLLLARGAGRNVGEIRLWAERARQHGDQRGDYLLGLLCDKPLRATIDASCAKPHYRAAMTAVTEAGGALLAVQQQFPEPGNPGRLARELAEHFQGAARFAVYRAYLRKVGGVPQMSIAEPLLRDLFDATTVSTSRDSSQANAIADPEFDQDSSVYNPTDAAVELARAYARNVGEESREKLFELLGYLRWVRPLEAAMIEASVYSDGNLVAMDTPAAQRLLQPWAEQSPAAAYALADLLRSGKVSEPDYANAERHFLRAADGGLGKSWYVLTRLYVGAPALTPDPARAATYGELARRAGYSHVDALLELIDLPHGETR